MKYALFLLSPSGFAMNVGDYTTEEEAIEAGRAARHYPHESISMGPSEPLPVSFIIAPASPTPF